MATVRPVLWTHMTSPRGHHPTRRRFADASRSLYHSVGVYLHPRHWNARAERVHKTHDLYEEISELIGTKLNAAGRERPRLFKTGEHPTAEALKAAVVGKGHTGCSLAYAEEFLDRPSAERRPRSRGVPCPPGLSLTQGGPYGVR